MTDNCLCLARVLAAACALLAVSQVYAEDYTALKYADVVVMGKIVDLEEVADTAARFYGSEFPGSDSLVVHVTRMRLEVDEVLRGKWEQETFPCYIPRSSNYKQNYAMGDRVVVSCIERPDLGNAYQVWADSGRFIWKRGFWECQGARDDARVLTDAQLRAVVSATVLENVQREAHLIVEGRIVDIESQKFEDSEGAASWVRKIALEPRTVYKGTADSSIVLIFLVESGSYQPQWRRSVPLNQQAGQHWLAFLKRAEGGYFPFAGSNGLFEIRGDEVIYAGRRPFQLDIEAMRQLLIRREIER